MAEFNTYPSLQLQNPDVLGQYIRGSLGGQQMQLGQAQLAGERMKLGYMPQQLAQEAEMRGLNLDQLRLAMQFQRMKMDFMGQAINEDQGATGGPGSTGQGAPSMGTAGGAQGDQGQAMSTGGSAPPGAPVQAQGFDTGQSHMGSATRRAIGMLDPEMAKGLAEAEQSNLKKAQLQAQPTLDLADNAISSANPERLVMNNPGTYGAAWRQFAPRLGLDPTDPRSLTPENARAAAVMFKNSIAGQVGLPSTPMPAEVTPVAGASGQLLGVTHGGTGPQGAISEISGQKMPGYSIEKRFNAATNRFEGVPVMTSPGGSAAPIAALMGAGGGGGVARSPSVLRTAAGLGPSPTGGAPRAPAAPGGGAGGIGAQVAPTVDLGQQPPTAEELKTAAVAYKARQPLKDLAAMEPKTILSPADRSLLVKALTSEGSSEGLKSLGTGYLEQKIEQLGFSGESGKYIQQLMPVLQAQAELAPRTRSGGVDIPSFRSSIEAIVPRSAAEVPAAQAQREANYHALLQSSGSAIDRYPDTLGADRTAGPKAAASQGSAPAGAIAHLKAHPELAPQFKAKYGYLP